ncbi:hypothetical protein [Streptomyces sp. NPDC005322]|uniref:hypothetical protein n=1 Tax=unclassified Streptomyces TaxID=2593676 RepID=UPI0033A63E8E
MPSPRPRLLPWPGENGKPCYLVTDDTADSFISRLADEMETVQLRTGADILGNARPLLGDHQANARELRFVGHRLAEALHDALRVAESRGMRLADREDPAPEQG